MFLLILNAFAYIITFLLYQKKAKSLQVGSVVLLTYALVSIGSVYLYAKYPMWGEWDWQNITFLPFLYLYIILLISFYPILLFNNRKIENIRMPNSTVMNYISIFIIIIYITFFFQTILSSFSIKDLFNSDILAENYEDKGKRMAAEGVINIFGVLKNIFSDILWIMFMYNWIFRKRIYSIGLLISIFVAMFTSLAWGARGPLMVLIMQIPFAFIIFKPLMSSQQKKQIAIITIAFISILLVGFYSLTYGRFSEHQNYSINDLLIYYISSDFLQFNNYAIDPGDCRYGDRVFPLVRMILGLDTAEDYMERRLLFPLLKIDDSQFMFFVGEFILDFGPYFAFLIISFFSFVFYHIFKKHKYDLGDITLGILWYNILIYGFTLFVYAERGGNLRILYVLLFAFIFKFFSQRSILYK